MKILIVEDEHILAKDLKSHLTSDEYACEISETLAQAEESIYLHQYDCVLLDLNLPDGEGETLIPIIRDESSSTGIIIISAKGSVEDKVRALQSGADDYLSKPFHPAELSARIHAVIRRKKFDSQNQIEFNEIRIDLLARTVNVNDSAIELTRKEFDLLIFFLGNKNRVLTKGALAEHLSGDFADMFDNYDFVYAHVKNLKRKLKESGSAKYIKTVYGSGYKWES
ncbi:MAG: response regulator [Bacteroidetes bacterium]|nr:response regulator [Bacteroidota bacterium]